jgi:hypothetical protein
MFSMDLSSPECSGHVFVALRRELDLIDAAELAAALRTVAAREQRIIVDLAGLKLPTPAAWQCWRVAVRTPGRPG